MRTIAVVTSLLALIFMLLPFSGKRASTGIMGKWKLVSTHLKGDSSTAGDPELNTLLKITADSTITILQDNEVILANKKLSISKKQVPASKKWVDVISIPEDELAEPFQTVWFKGEKKDTLLFITLNPHNNFEPYIYSQYVRIGE